MFKKIFLFCCIILFSSLLEAKDKGGEMRILSSAFEDKSAIPAKYTCEGEDISPPLIFEKIPQEAKSLALIMDDPDAQGGTFVHWVVYDIDPHITKVPENQPNSSTILGGAKQGTNDFPKIGYGGPCPPNGEHKYVFKLYALDTMLDLDPSLTKLQLLKYMQRHIIAQSILIGTYKKRVKRGVFSFLF